MATDEQNKLIELLIKQRPQKADAIVLLAGDRFHRVPKTAELFHAGYAPVVVLTSNADNWDYGSLPSSRLVAELKDLDVPEEAIIWEETAAHTRAEADSTLRIAKERGWKTLLIVTTEYHQYRAFLTWLKAIEDHGMDTTLIMASVEEYPSFHNDTREDALIREFDRIAQYQTKGDVSSYPSGIEYLNKRVKAL